MHIPRDKTSHLTIGIASRWVARTLSQLFVGLYLPPVAILRRCVAPALLLLSVQAGASDLTLTNTAEFTYRGIDQGVTATVDFSLMGLAGQPPTDISAVCLPDGCTGLSLDENLTDLSVAVLTVVDADQASGHVITVDDPRFEIIGTVLRLRAGVSLDFETEGPTVTVLLRAVDTDGNPYEEPLVLTINDVNEAPMDLVLGNAVVTAGEPGAKVGDLSAVDADAGDIVTFSVAGDPRFRVVNDVLLLAEDASLPLGSSIELTLTATDSDGLTTELVVTVTAEEAQSQATDAIIQLVAPSLTGQAIDIPEASCTLPGALADSASSRQLPVRSAAIAEVITLDNTQAYAAGDEIIVLITDADENLSADLVESVVVTLTTLSGDSETVTATESDVNTGIFVARLPSSLSPSSDNDCLLTVGIGDEISAAYTDDDDTDDQVVVTTAVSPIGIVFDDETGQPVDGIILTLIDVATGDPAVVSGDGPGFGRYPAAVKSGESVTDQVNITYDFGDGEYRFPALASGQYRIEIFNARGWAISTKPDAELQLLPGGAGRPLTPDGPYALVSASRGDPVILTQGALPRIDIPVTRLQPAVSVQATSSAIQFFQYSANPLVGTPFNVGQTTCISGSTRQVSELRDVSVPVPGLVNLVPTEVFKAGQPIFVRVTDMDQNNDPAVRERIVIQLDVAASRDREYLDLLETGPDSGEFIGYVQSDEEETEVGSCTLGVVKDETITTTYVDAFDDTDVSDSEVLVDPFGRLFSTLDGSLINGVTVTLIDMATGLPARVFGDGPFFADYPNSLVSGEGATDSAGLVYDFPDGEYRFPFVEPGFYRLVLTDIPDGMVFPSAVDNAAIQLLSGAPFQVVAGSRGEEFEVPIGPALHIDIPLDQPNGEMAVTKQASAEIVGIGDFLQYKVTVSNKAASLISDARLLDTLPVGFRYESGSMQIAGAKAAEPIIGEDGRALTVNLPSIGSEPLEIRYVVSVTPGAVKGEARNMAMVAGEFVESSNTAIASVTVRDDLNTSKAFLAGRVYIGNCDVTADGVRGLPSARLFMEDGTNVLTDDEGRWHLEGIDPGTHVVQLDLDSLPERYEVSPCNENSRFAGSPHSQFVDVQAGTLWRVDFSLQQKAEPESEVSLTQTMLLEGESMKVAIDVAQSNDIALSDVSVIYNLPKGWIMRNGTARLNGQPVTSQRSIVGEVFKVGTVTADRRLTFVLEPKVRPAIREAENKMLVLRPRFKTRSAELEPGEYQELAQLVRDFADEAWDEVLVLGHADNVPIAPEHRHEYIDNLALSDARADTVVRYLRDRVNIPLVNWIGVGDRYPIALNDSSEGRRQNRRVEILLRNRYGPKTIDLDPALFNDASKVRLMYTSAGTDKGKTEINRLPLEQMLSGFTSISAEVTGIAKGSWDTVEMSAETDVRDPGVQGFISLYDGKRLVHSSTSVKVDLDTRLKVRLFVDDVQVANDRIGFRMEDESTGKSLYRFIGVNIGEPGVHRVRLEGVDGFGNARFSEEISVIRVGEIDSIQKSDEQPVNIADGKSPIALRIDLLDEAQELIEAEFSLLYESEQLSAYQADKSLSELANEIDYGDFVRVNNSGLVQFNPVSESGSYRVRIQYKDISEWIEFSVEPEQRDWIMVGLAEGSVMRRDISGNLESLAENDLNEETSVDGRVAFYAKGRVRGDYVMTIAYDSDKQKKNALYQAIDPNTYYTLYGDRTSSQYDAASGEKLFLKIERAQFNAIFGDFSTNMSVTELANYSRNFTGLQSEYKTDKLELSGFVSESDQAFIKDEIRGDGTSGLYRLSAKGIVENSEQVTIETRDRFHSEQILDTAILRRHLDYDIDYQASTIFFKAPVYSQDEGFNPIFIVADYEVKGDGKDRLNLGARISYSPTDRIQIGGTVVREGTMNRETDLIGIDSTFRLTERTEITAEYATTTSMSDGAEITGDAFVAEITHRGRTIDGRAYIRQQDANFGVGQQSASESATRKMGVEAKAGVKGVEVVGEVYQQEQMTADGDATTEVAALSVNRSSGAYALSSGVRSSTATSVEGEKRTSSQLVAGGSYQVGKAKFDVNADTALGGDEDAGDFPRRLRVGLDYKLSERVTFRAEQELSWGSDQDTQGTRISVNSSLWQGAQLSTNVERTGDENSERVAAVTGLKQKFNVGDQWSFDIGVDRSQTLKNESQLAVPDLQVTTVYSSPGGNDFTAVTFGSRFEQQDWDWSTRVEYRTADSENKLNLLSDVVHNLSEGHALLAKFGMQKTDGLDSRQTQTDVQLGYVFRPDDSRWTLFNRLDLRSGSQQNYSFDTRTQKIINNLNANYLWDDKTQVALHYGAKYVVDSFDGSEYRGFTDLMGLEVRHDLNARWDLGFQGSSYSARGAGVSDTSYGVSIGYSMAKNVWMSLGYNFSGFSDRDFDASEYASEGVFLKYRMKFDQYTAKSIRELMR